MSILKARGKNPSFPIQFLESPQKSPQTLNMKIYHNSDRSNKMSVYMTRLFPRSNSSFFLRSGNALEAKVVGSREEMYLIDAGVGRPRVTTQNELIKPPKTAGPTSFSCQVGFLNPSNADFPVKNLILQRCFIDLVTGDSRTKQQAAARFDDIIGENDAAGGSEQPLLLPRRFRKHRAWLELKNMWRANPKVKGFVAEKLRGGYSIGVAGYFAFLPNRYVKQKRITSDRLSSRALPPRILWLPKPDN